MNSITSFFADHWQTICLIPALSVLLIVHAVVGPPEGDEGPEGEDLDQPEMKA